MFKKLKGQQQQQQPAQRARIAQQLIDPRTQLPLVDVPSRFLPALQALQECVMHYIGLVRKISSKSFREGEKLCVIGDAAMYVCDLDGGVKRCVLFRDLRDLVVKDDDDLIGFRLDVQSEFDVLLRFGNDYSRVLQIIQVIYWTYVGKDLELTRVGAGDRVEPCMMLQKPSGWQLRIEPLRSKKYLEKLILSQKTHNQQNQEKVQEEFTRIKRELLTELETKRNENYDRMVFQVVSYVRKLEDTEAQLEDAQREIDRLRHQLDPRYVAQATVAARTMSGEEQTATAAGEVDSSMAWLNNSPSPSANFGNKTFAASPTRARGAGSSGGTCMECARLRRMLESHPNTDKKMILALEEQVAAANKATLAVKKEMLPEREENAALRGSIVQADGILRDQQYSLTERIRATLKLLAPHCDPSSTSAVGGPPPVNASTLGSEIQALRQVLRDVHVYHNGQLKALEEQFQAYDEHMVATMKSFIESTHLQVPETSTAQIFAAEVVNEGKKGFQQQQQQQQGVRGSPSRLRTNTTTSSTPPRSVRFAAATAQQQQLDYDSMTTPPRRSSSPIRTIGSNPLPTAFYGAGSSTPRQQQQQSYVGNVTSPSAMSSTTSGNVTLHDLMRSSSAGRGEQQRQQQLHQQSPFFGGATSPSSSSRRDGIISASSFNQSGGGNSSLLDQSGPIRWGR